MANSRKIRVQGDPNLISAHIGVRMHFGVLALYGGPDQVMTVTSGIASIIGVLLIFWHKVVNAFFKVFGIKRNPPATETEQNSPKTPSQAE
jgi:hypothetical protein